MLVNPIFEIVAVNLCEFLKYLRERLLAWYFHRCSLFFAAFWLVLHDTVLGD